MINMTLIWAGTFFAYLHICFLSTTFNFHCNLIHFSCFRLYLKDALSDHKATCTFIFLKKSYRIIILAPLLLFFM